MFLPRRIYDKMIAQARVGRPYEVCALLRGGEGVVKDWYPVRNIAADRRHDYEIAPEALLAAFAWEESGDELIAIFHSHPYTPAYPSASDAWYAYYPDTIYLICSLAAESRPQVCGFYLRQKQTSLALATLRKDFSFRQARPHLWSLHLPAHTPLPSYLQAVMPDPPADLYVLYRQTSSGQPPLLRLVSVAPVEINVGNLS